MKRLHGPRRHSLTFEIPGSSNGVNTLDFCSYEQIMGMEISYDIPDELLEELGLSGSRHHSENLERFVKKFCPKRDVRWIVKRVLKSVSRLRLELSRLYLQFVPESQFGGGFGGRGITGKGRRSLLLIEFILDPRGMAFPVDKQCNDLIPYELMHMKDVLDGRSPTMYPGALPEEGGWIDLFRHLWIDGHLEQTGFPHFRKEGRLSQVAEELKLIGKEPSVAELSALGNMWWGKPMALRDAIQIGLDLGFTLEKGCPLEKWFSTQSSQRRMGK